MLAKKCIVCDNSNLKRVIKLGFHPLADTFLKKEQLLLPLNTYPLNCLLCKNCGHLQNEYFTPGDERYVESNYSYTSFNSDAAKKHWLEFFDSVSKYTHVESTDHVIEFGSNDGHLLSHFKKKGIRVTGIDPSPIMIREARKIGVDSIEGFVGKDTIAAAVKKKGMAKIIMGNNVVNHIENLKEAMLGIKSGLKNDGYFIFEVPSLKDTVEKYLFDMIFHEHISTFSVRSADTMLKRYGLYIVHVENVNYHGGSLRIISTPNVSAYNAALVRKSIKAEENAKIFNPKTYAAFMAKIIKDKNDVLAKVYALKKKGKKIAAIGAGARSNTLLNFYRLDSTVIEFVTDASKYKIGKYTPGSLIPIKNDTSLQAENIDVALITAWNIGKYLTEKIRKINDTIEFIVPGEKELL
ncbi:MAG TPA: class I SAM-dependent methyltransferase [Patescibacteria group bacterium]|nr:class I SAM-dependent methyltransferase [Patescibacteria group bacterium]